MLENYRHNKLVSLVIVNWNSDKYCKVKSHDID